MSNPKAPTKRELRSMRWFAHRDTVRRSKKREQEAKGERDRNLATVSKRCKATRKRTTKLCAKDRARIREKARAIVAREKELRADARADYRYETGRAKLAKGPRYSAAEHDSLTEHNIPKRYVELWKELANNFPRTVTPDNRAELFMEWIEEHPNEVTAWQTERYDATPEEYAAAYEAHISEQLGREYVEAVPF